MPGDYVLICKGDKFNVFQATESAAGLTAIFITVNPSYTSLIVCVKIYGLSDGSFFTCMNCLALTVSPLKLNCRCARRDDDGGISICGQRSSNSR